MKRVLLVATTTLFGRGVENLLLQEPCLEFLGCEIDVNKAMVHIEDLKPDVVIIEKGILKTDQGHPLQCMLRARKQLKVIELDPEDETICIYSCRQKIIKHVQDLVEIIEQTEEV